jgi:hypothetical protein
MLIKLTGESAHDPAALMVSSRIFTFRTGVLLKNRLKQFQLIKNTT